MNQGISFFVYPDDVAKFQECLDEISNLFDGGQQISSDLFDRLMSYLHKQEDAEMLEYQKKHGDRFKKAVELAPKLTKEAVEYFKSTKIHDDYNIYGKTKQTYLIPPEIGSTNVSSVTIDMEYSTEQLLSMCISNYLLFVGETKSKKEAIEYFITCIDNYVGTAMSDTHIKIFTDYKRKVIAGYLTMKVAGWQLFDPIKSETFTNQHLFDAVRNALNDKKQKGQK